jgi:hypothetical protein
MARGQLILDPKADEATADELAEAFAAAGIQCEEGITIDEDEFWLWPENEEVFRVWLGLQTQWMVGMSGATGLSYPGVESDLRMLGIPTKKRRQFYVSIKHMEHAALEEWASKR